MKIHSIQAQTFILFAFFFGYVSCKGQDKTEKQAKNLLEMSTSLIPQNKLRKTQGTNESQIITCGIQDTKGNLWFGTSGEGVYKYDGKLFTQFTTKDGLKHNHVWSMLEDETGKIWFGTRDGICYINGDKIMPLSINFNLRPMSTENTYYNEWSTKNNVWSMMQDRSGKIWFGTGEAVYWYDGKQLARFLYLDEVINHDSLKLNMVSDILEDKEGIIWFASGMPPGYEGICRFDGKKIEHFTPQHEGWIRNIVESKNGHLLFATRHFGVWSYDGKSFKDYSQPKELIKPSLNRILEDHSGNLWVASDYGKDMGDTLGGLWYSDKSISNHQETTFTKITNQEVNMILEDHQHHIWFGTRGMGLYCYDGKTITKYSE